MDELARNVPLGIKRLVITPIIAAHHRVNNDRCAVIQSSGPVVAQDDWIGDALGMPTDPAQREKIVAIKAGVTDLHA